MWMYPLVIMNVAVLRILAGGAFHEAVTTGSEPYPAAAARRK
jgi:hypothetical protein